MRRASAWQAVRNHDVGEANLLQRHKRNVKDSRRIRMRVEEDMADRFDFPSWYEYERREYISEDW